MKVLLINTVNLEANGISTFIINTAKQLVKDKIDVTILAPNDIDNKLASILKKQGIHLKQISGRMSNPIKYFNNLRSYLASKKFDVVHVNGNSTTMSVELFAAKLAGVKKRIAHSHNTTTEHPIINILLKPLFEACVSERLACNKAAGRWLFENKNFTVIPNGINLNKYQFNQVLRIKYRKKLRIKSNEILLGHVGEFNYQKNQLFLIELLKELPENYKLVLVGQGEKINSVKDRVKELKLSSRVIFTGVIDNVADYLNAMDLFLLPSKFEGQPFVLVEAAANGLGCIGSTFISQESNIVPFIRFIPLKTYEWKKTIENWNFGNRIDSSVKNRVILKSKGFDLNSNSSRLISIYQKE